jgi:hypothetical protein
VCWPLVSGCWFPVHFKIQKNVIAISQGGVVTFGASTADHNKSWVSSFGSIVRNFLFHTLRGMFYDSPFVCRKSAKLSAEDWSQFLIYKNKSLRNRLDELSIYNGLPNLSWPFYMGRHCLSKNDWHFCEIFGSAPLTAAGFLKTLCIPK